jgi:hypothetical protein
LGGFVALGSFVGDGGCCGMVGAVGACKKIMMRVKMIAVQMAVGDIVIVVAGLGIVAPMMKCGCCTCV